MARPIGSFPDGSTRGPDTTIPQGDDWAFCWPASEVNCCLSIVYFSEACYSWQGSSLSLSLIVWSKIEKDDFIAAVVSKIDCFGEIDGGGIRPIAVGCILHCLVSKLLEKQVHL